MACVMSRATAYRVLARYRAGGWEALRDRPPIARQHRSASRCEAEQQIVELRRETGWGPQSLGGGAGPAGVDDLARARAGYGSSRAAAAPRPPANRYEYAAPGELVHLDIKQLGRFWQLGKRVLGRRRQTQSWRRLVSYAHVAVDDHSRHADRPAVPNGTGDRCVAFPRRSSQRYAEHGTPISGS